MSTETPFQMLAEVTDRLQSGDTPHRAAAAALEAIREHWGQLLSDIDEGNMPAGLIPPKNLLFMYDTMISTLTDHRDLVEQELNKAFPLGSYECQT